MLLFVCVFCECFILLSEGVCYRDSLRLNQGLYATNNPGLSRGLVNRMLFIMRLVRVSDASSVIILLLEVLGPCW